MLDLAFGLTDTSRLGCQVKVTKEQDGMKVQLPLLRGICTSTVSRSQQRSFRGKGMRWSRAQADDLTFAAVFCNNNQVIKQVTIEEQSHFLSHRKRHLLMMQEDYSHAVLYDVQCQKLSRVSY